MSAFRADKSGASIVEFALIAGPFFFMLGSVFELGMMMIAGVDLKGSADDVAREIRIGHTQCMSQDELVNEICGNSVSLPNCQDRLSVEQNSSPLGFGSGMAELLDGETFKEVQSGEVVIIQASYRWAVISPLVSAVMGDEAGDVEIQQSFVFQNETFGAQSCS